MVTSDLIYFTAWIPALLKKAETPWVWVFNWRQRQERVYIFIIMFLSTTVYTETTLEQKLSETTALLPHDLHEPVSGPSYQVADTQE